MNKTKKQLEEYKIAYEYLLEQIWADATKEERHNLNQELNAIFKLNEDEQNNEV